MIGHRGVGLVVVLMLARAGWGQIDAHAIEQDLKGKKVALRSFSAEPITQYEWVNDKFAAKPVHLFTPSVFMTRSVKLKNSLLVFEGDRHTLVRDPGKNVLSMTGEAPMRLEIDLHNAPPGLTLPMLETMLFFTMPQTRWQGCRCP